MVPLAHAQTRTGDQTYNPHMCPQPGIEPLPLGARGDTLTNKPYWPGLGAIRIVFTWKESMQTGLDASSSSTACNFSMKVLSLVCLGFGGGGGPMGTTSALMCLMAGVAIFSA